MERIFEWIANIVQKRPVKIFIATTLIFIIMIAGALQIQMATGNETLVKTTNDAYISNLKMEEDFGGDSIIVLFEAEDQKALTSLRNIRSMWNVEQAMQYEENIFSFMSPASIVNQISERQSDEIKSRVKEISDGLYEMSAQMAGTGEDLGNKKVNDPKEMEKKLGELSQSAAAFDKLIEAQNKLGTGTIQLQSGMGELAIGLEQISLQLNQLSEDVNDHPELAQQLEMLATKIETSAQGLANMSDKTGELQKGSEGISQALSEMENKISSESRNMRSSLSGGLSLDQLENMTTGFTNISENLNNIANALNMFYEKSGMMIPDIPTTQDELDNILYENDNQLRSAFADIVPDENHALMIVKLEGNLEDTQKDEIYERLDEILARQEFEEISYLISGRPVLDTSLRAEMQDNMKNMVVLAVGIMIIILMIIFKVKWRILPLITVFIAVIATLGIMGYVGIPMTMVSMAVFPILIGLGIDYSIQFQSRYDEEKSFKVALRQMGPVVGIAVFATVLGFIALYISPVPMVQDFGKMLTIGVIISYIAGIFFLMPLLYIRDRFFSVENKSEDHRFKIWFFKKITGSEIEIKSGTPKFSLLESILKKVTRVILKLSPIILIAAIALAGWGIWSDGKVGVQTDIESFMPQDTPALMDIHQLRDVLGTTDQIVLYIEDDNVLSQENLNWIEEKTKDLKDQFSDIIVDARSISTVVNNMAMEEDLSYEEMMVIIEELPETQKKLFVTPEQDKAVISLGIKHVPIGDLQTFISDLEEEIQDTNMNIDITGKSVLDVEMIKGLTSGRIEMTFLGMGLVFIGLLLVYRNLFKAFIPVFPISLIVGLSGGIMYLLDLKYTPLTATLGALILGIGTEMTILLLERYLEERKHGKNKLEAMETAVSKIGVAIIASGATTIGGFSVLMISDFVILKDFGLMTVINMSLALFSTLIVLPPVIYLFDRWIIGRKLEKQQ